MNFFDLCAAGCRAIGRGCKGLGRLLAQMTRLTVRYWWIVVTVLLLSLAAALYYSRNENLIYKMNTVALLNGPSIQQFEQAYAPLRSARMLPPQAAVAPFVYSKAATRFETFRVVDAKEDGNADFVDFKRKSIPTDTVSVQMHDRLCLQFRVKVRNMPAVPEMERAILEWLNSNLAMQNAYRAYLPNLREEVIFNHRQAQKLDSLTSAYYFFNASNAQPLNSTPHGNGVNFYGDRKIHLFLDDLYEQREHLQQGDYRMQLATAPVVLENHFAVDPTPVNGRLKCLILFLLAGWIVGCAIAACIDRRKAICAWLKQ